MIRHAILILMLLAVFAAAGCVTDSGGSSRRGSDGDSGHSH